MTKAILEVINLKKHYTLRCGLFSKTKYVYAVDDISFSVKAGETLGLVGESGCGKSSLGRALLKLEEPTSGQIIYNGKDITHFTPRQMVSLRKEIQIIFQDPMESLNSRHTVGSILEEPFEIHKIGTKKERKQKVRDLLIKVGLSASASERYPHEFSGGQRQRIGIARAIALNPKLIICDEAVSALDVSVQSQIINLLLELQKTMNLALVFIAHDLSVVRHISDNIAVMYLGKVVEMSDTQSLFANPQHPYTRALISAIPLPDPRLRGQRVLLKGDVPSPISPPDGCYFASRCHLATPECTVSYPDLKIISPNHSLACHLTRKETLV
jgi:peptide/nickel transport system ATP-binding protein